MNAAMGHALEQALAYYRAPAMLPVARERRLPDDVLDVLRIAAGDESLLAQHAGSSGEPPATVMDAAVFFVQQVLFAPGADSYRVLGVNTDAPDARIKENYRWLVRWLHPDRNLDDWDTVYAERVNRAWQDLRLPDRRAAYDAQRLADGPGTPSPVTVPARPHGRLHDAGALADPLLSARTAQRLPAFVLGGLGLAAISLLALMWVTADPPAATAPMARPGTPIDPDALRLPNPEPAAVAPTDAVAVLPEPTPTPAPQVVAEPAPLPERVASAPPAAPAPTPAPQASEPAASVAATQPRPVAPAPVRAPVAAPVAAPTPAPTPAAPAPRIAAASTPKPPARFETPRPAPREAAPGEAAPPVAAVPAAPAPPPVVPPVDRQQAYAVLERFSTVYAAGDIGGLMRLFTTDARNNRGGRDAIAYDYQSLFNGTDQRSLRFVPVGWMQRDDDNATLLARYEASVTQPGKRRADLSSGQIRFDLRRENGQLMISQIRIENAD